MRTSRSSAAVVMPSIRTARRSDSRTSTRSRTIGPADPAPSRTMIPRRPPTTARSWMVMSAVDAPETSNTGCSRSTTSSPPIDSSIMIPAMRVSSRPQPAMVRPPSFQSSTSWESEYRPSYSPGARTIERAPEARAAASAASRVRNGASMDPSPSSLASASTSTRPVLGAGPHAESQGWVTSGSPPSGAAHPATRSSPIRPPSELIFSLSTSFGPIVVSRLILRRVRPWGLRYNPAPSTGPLCPPIRRRLP